jgi:hypothetical protein
LPGDPIAAAAPSHGSPAFDKLEPALAALQNAADRNSRFTVIVQFEEDGDAIENGPSGLAMKQERANERAMTVSHSGGIVERAFLNFPAVVAGMNPNALAHLSTHPLVKHISMDCAVEGSLSNTVLFINPYSIIDAESILAYGDEGIVPNLVVGPPNAWFYPIP